MHSLLTNPLFNLPPELRTGNVVYSRDPMDIFTQAVAKGMMTTSYAKACLTAKKVQIVQSAVLNVRDGMKKSRAGMQVLKWLVSSGTTNTTDFLKDGDFAMILMEYIVAEGLQETAWKWVKKALENFSALSLLSGKEFVQAQREVVGPLLYLVRAEATSPDSPTNLDAAYMAMSRAAGYLGGLSRSEMHRVLSPPGRFLIRGSLIPRASRPPPSEAAFESFLSLIPVISNNHRRYFAHLSLLHPTKPNADLALEYIQALEATSQQTGPISKPATESDHENIQLGLDTANCLLVQHRYTEADQVMEFLRSNYPKQLGIKEMRQLEQAKAEASSLELLERLGLA